jgi:hypothetical protein
MAATTRRSFLASAGALVAGLGIGIVVGSEVLRRPRSPVEAIGPSAASSPEIGADLADALQELSRTLAELRRAIERGAPSLAAVPPDGVAREAVHAASDEPARESQDLAAALHELAAALRGLGTRPTAGGAAATTALVVPRWVDRKAAFAGTGMLRAAQSDDHDAVHAAERALDQRHMFWTQQQVLDAYGRPDHIEVDSGLVAWSYEVVHEDGASEEYYFYFHDGVVASVSYGYDEP